MSQPRFTRSLLHPKFWPSWLGFGVWWFIVQLLPFSWQMAIGARMGLLMARLSPRRSRIARKNMEICMPEASEAEREVMFRRCMESVGKGVLESGMAWFWPKWRFKGLCRIEGLEHLEKAKDDGHGVLFMGIHFTTIEICAAFINQETSIDGFYRPHDNVVYEFLQAWGRTRHNENSKVISRRDVRSIVRALRQKRVINYAPDQDYGRRNSIFVPFFGMETATVTAPSQLVRTGKARIIPYVTGREKGDRGYYVKIYPPFEDFAQGDDVADATRINAFIEDRVRENFDQYLWVHRRFKTRPPGVKRFY